MQSAAHIHDDYSDALQAANTGDEEAIAASRGFKQPLSTRTTGTNGPNRGVGQEGKGAIAFD